MTRRQFLERLVGLVAVARVAPSLVSAPPTGIAIRFVRGFEGGHVTRLDVRYGWATVRPDLAARVEG